MLSNILGTQRSTKESGLSEKPVKKLEFPNFIKLTPKKVKIYEIFILTVLNNKIYFTCLQYQKRIGGVYGSSRSRPARSASNKYSHSCLVCPVHCRKTRS
uniref:Uncharacterized protein n=1 Tax=Methanosarcina barkeri (strain Fusaro / DSM 804) TaxID=269797 RepID=Q468C2_METBF